MDVAEKFEFYCEQKRLYRLEGEMVVQRLEQMFCDIGGYSSLAGFLSDNPGACEALLEWFAAQFKRLPEWHANLDEQLGDYPDDDGQPDEAQEWESYDPDC